MSGLAIAMKEQGAHVTGSDKGFYPPVSTALKKAGIAFYPGWHQNKMIESGIPDLVVVGNVASSENPEWQYVQKHNLSYTSYPGLIQKYFVKKNSIVCAGTYGKTTSTALLTWILVQAGWNPSYMFGGIYADVEHCVETHCNLSLQPSARITNSDWSIVEGDEYKTARWDNRPKFAHYSPTHVLLTSVVWDHADVYPTPETYEKAYEKLAKSVPKSGVLVACEDDPNVANIVTLSHCHIVRYGQSIKADYMYHDVRETKNGVEFSITMKQCNNVAIAIKSPMLGQFSATNITGCFALAHQIGIPEEKIVQAIKNFPGVKRRLECRLRGEIDIYDDIAHSPTKAQAVLKSLKALYSGLVIAIFEPNTGNREHMAIVGYDHTFKSADMVIIPHLTKVKKNPFGPQPMEGEELAAAIAKTHTNVQYIDNDEQVIQTILQTAKPGDTVIFLGSHGFRGMIETAINRVRKVNST